MMHAPRCRTASSSSASGDLFREKADVANGKYGLPSPPKCSLTLCIAA